jgi:hypothetical protein
MRSILPTILCQRSSGSSAQVIVIQGLREAFHQPQMTRSRCGSTRDRLFDEVRGREDVGSRKGKSDIDDGLFEVVHARSVEHAKTFSRIDGVLDVSRSVSEGLQHLITSHGLGSAGRQKKAEHTRLSPVVVIDPKCVIGSIRRGKFASKRDGVFIAVDPPALWCGMDLFSAERVIIIRPAAGLFDPGRNRSFIRKSLMREGLWEHGIDNQSADYRKSFLHRSESETGAAFALCADLL